MMAEGGWLSNTGESNEREESVNEGIECDARARSAMTNSAESLVTKFGRSIHSDIPSPSSSNRRTFDSCGESPANWTSPAPTLATRVLSSGLVI